MAACLPPVHVKSIDSRNAPKLQVLEVVEVEAGLEVGFDKVQGYLRIWLFVSQSSAAQNKCLISAITIEYGPRQTALRRRTPDLRIALGASCPFSRPSIVGPYSIHEHCLVLRRLPRFFLVGFQLVGFFGSVCSSMDQMHRTCKQITARGAGRVLSFFCLKILSEYKHGLCCQRSDDAAPITAVGVHPCSVRNPCSHGVEEMSLLKVAGQYDSSPLQFKVCRRLCDLAISDAQAQARCSITLHKLKINAMKTGNTPKQHEISESSAGGYKAGWMLERLLNKSPQRLVRYRWCTGPEDVARQALWDKLDCMSIFWKIPM